MIVIDDVIEDIVKVVQDQGIQDQDVQDQEVALGVNQEIDEKDIEIIQGIEEDVEDIHNRGYNWFIFNLE